MGTINYYTSDYITLGVKPYETDDFINDSDFLDFIRDEWNVDTENENELINAVYEEISDCYECDRENINAILCKYSFYYFHVAIKAGYYEGFTLDIENNFGVCYDTYLDRFEAQKEVTKLKAFLIECAGCGLVSVGPGWVTTYGDYNSTLQDINKAIKQIRLEVKNIPTWNQYRRATEG